MTTCSKCAVSLNALSQIEDLLQNVDGVASEYTVTLAHDDEKEPRYHDSNCRGGGTLSFGNHRTENKGTVQIPHRRHPESDCHANQDPATKRKKTKRVTDYRET